MRGVFVHVDAAHHTERERDDGTAYHQVEGTYDGGEDTAACHTVFRRFGQEFPVDDSGSFHDDEAQNEEEQQGYAVAEQAEAAEHEPLQGALALHIGGIGFDSHNLFLEFVAGRDELYTRVDE